MIAAVIPVKNEATSLYKVIKTTLNIGTDLIIPVFNGCTDQSHQIIKMFGVTHISPLYFIDSLGIDVPRAAGAALAYTLGAETVFFVDGDMAGNIGKTLKKLVLSITRKRLCLALTDCYPPEEEFDPSPLTSYLLDMRFILNKSIGLKNIIGCATPSHGPHAVSRKFLEQIPFHELAIPPVALALAARRGLPVDVGARLPHVRLGSRQRDPVHSYRIAETIIGDCIEALQAYNDQSRNRSKEGIIYTGYHLERRFDLLKEFLKNTLNLSICNNK